MNDNNGPHDRTGVPPEDRTDILLDDLRAEMDRLADAVEELNDRIDAAREVDR